jgi:hypothetical protein
VRRIGFLRREDGVAMTEFALVIPVFLVVVAGLLGFGRVFFYWIETNHEASEAARWAVVDRNPYSPQTLQQHAIGGSTIEFQSGTSVCIDYPEDGTPAVNLGDPIRVTIKKPMTLVPILGIGTITIRGSSTQRIERFDADGTYPPTNYKTGAVVGGDIGTCT